MLSFRLLVRKWKSQTRREFEIISPFLLFSPSTITLTTHPLYIIIYCILYFQNIFTNSDASSDITTNIYISIFSVFSKFKFSFKFCNRIAYCLNLFSFLFLAKHVTSRFSGHFYLVFRDSNWAHLAHFLLFESTSKARQFSIECLSSGWETEAK